MKIFDKNWIAVMGLCLLTAAACRKTEDPPIKVGGQLPYKDSLTKSLTQVLDSLPESSLYKAILKRSDLQHYMDSLANGSVNVPYTLLVPTDKALTAAGYTMDAIQAAPVEKLDTLIRYLSLPGSLNPNTWLQTGLNLNPLMYPDFTLSGSAGGFPFGGFAYYYTINVSFASGALWLNGHKVSGQALPIAATDGTIFRIDTLVQKPVGEVYQLLNADTSYSYYMAAMRINDSLYTAQGIIGAPYFNVCYCDTCSLQFSNPDNTGAGINPFAVVLAPTNDAFRKAGFQTIGDISQYVNNSALASAPYGTFMLTNMDSVLQNHQFLYGFLITLDLFSGYFYTITNGNYVYTNDMLNDPTIVQYSIIPAGITTKFHLNNVVFRNEGGRPVAYRIDNPAGPGAALTDPDNITALNGVIHRVDHLLMPAK